MGICRDCGNEMLDGKSCTLTSIILQTRSGMEIAKEQNPNLAFDLLLEKLVNEKTKGSEIYGWFTRDSEYFDVNRNCHDCGVENKKGNYHHFGCDMERCPVCKGQLISCGHATENSRVAVIFDNYVRVHKIDR